MRYLALCACMLFAVSSSVAQSKQKSGSTSNKSAADSTAPQATAESSSSTAPESPAPSVTIERDRKLVPQDLLEISLVGEREIDKMQTRIFAGGTINVPFIQKPVMVAGKTPSQVKEELEKLLKEYFVDPQIILRVAEYRKRWFTVDGKVVKPGVFELPAEQRLDLLAAIATAGGLSPLAKDKIELNRPGQPIRKFKLEDLRKETDTARKIYIEPEDLIFVHESAF